MTYETWDYHATIIVTNPSATADVQASMVLEKSTGMNADYSDIRFATTDGAALSYWIEASDESSVTVWVKLPADDESIVLYWGNEDAESESSGDDTFEFFDGFDGDTLDTFKWTANGSVTISNGQITIPSGIEIFSIPTFGLNNIFVGNVDLGSLSSYSCCGFSQAANTDRALFYTNWQTANQLNITSRESSNTTSVPIGTTYTGFNTYRIDRINSALINYYINDLYVGNKTTEIPTISTNITMFAQSHTIYADYIFVCKYVETEPEISIHIDYPESYPYSIILDVVNPSTTDGVQVKFELPLQDNMEADFSQLYFSKTDDLTSSGRIPYWIESADAELAHIWVKLPADTYSILLSWGVDDLIAAPSGDDTFELFEGTHITNYLSTDTVTPIDIIYESKVRGSGDINIWYGLGTTQSDKPYNGLVIKPNIIGSTYSNNYEFVWLNGAQSEHYINSYTVANQWYKLKIERYDDIAYFYIDDETFAEPITTNLPTVNLHLGLNIYSGTPEQEWAFVRKYVATQPEIVLRTNYRELFSHRATITITDPSATEGVQAMFELPLLRDMAADYADIRFSTTEGRALPYWIEATDVASATVWVKIPAVDPQIYMYWGNSEAVSESSGYDTFEFFDDFTNDVDGWAVRDCASVGSRYIVNSSGALIQSGSDAFWISGDTTTRTNYAILVKFAVPFSGYYHGPCINAITGDREGYLSRLILDSSSIYICDRTTAGSDIICSASIPHSANTYYTYQAASYGNTISILDAQNNILCTGTSTLDSGQAGSYSYNSSVTIDFYAVRKYNLIEPTLTLSTGYLQTDLNQHTIAVQYPSAVADVQTLFTFLRRNGMNADYSDLRFAGWGSENRPYWIESANAASAAVWISLPADDTFIYYYWGDDTAVAASSGADTFDAFVADDLTDWDVYTADDCTVSIVNDALQFYVPATAGMYAYIKSKTAMTGEFIIESVASFSHQDVNAYTFSSIGLGFPYFIDGNGVVIRDYSSGDIKVAVEQKTGEITTSGDVALIGDASTELQRYYLTSKDDYYVGYLTDTGTLDRLVETDNKVILGITTDSSTAPSHDSHVYTTFAFVRKYVEIQPILTQGEFSDSDNLALWGRSVDILLDVETVVDNQQVLVTLPFLKNMADDFSDIRFADSELTQMPHWIDSKEDLIEAKVWVNVPTSGSTSIKCVYKMAGASDASDGPGTFDVFDHFDGSAIDAEIWEVHEGTPAVADSIVNLPATRIKTVAQWDLGYAVHAMVRRVPDIDDSIGFNDLVGHSRESITAASGSFFMARNSNTIDYVKTVDTVLAEDTNWHIRDIAATPSGSVRLSIDNELLYTETDPTYVYVSGSIPVTLYGGQVDWFSIRKAVDVEPVATVDVDALYSTWDYSDIISFDIPTIVEDQLCSVVITARDGMNSDFSDLRFATRQGTELRYAMEPPEYTSSAKFWIEVQSIGTTEVIAYWGSASALDESEWDELFPIMHEFFEDGIDAEKWPTATGAIVTDGPDKAFGITPTTSLVSNALTTGIHQIEFEIKLTAWNSNGPRVAVDYDNTKHYIEIYANGTGDWHDVWLGTRAGTELSRVERPWSSDTWYTYKIVSTPTLQKLIVSNNNVSLNGSSARAEEYTDTFTFSVWDGTSARIKDIKVRPYIAQDPVLSFPDSIGAADDVWTDFVGPITGLEEAIESYLIGLPGYKATSDDTRIREIAALFESVVGATSVIDGSLSYLETFLDAVVTPELASDDESRERTTPTLLMSNLGISGISADVYEYALGIFESSTSLKKIGSALRTSVRQRPGNSTRMNTPFSMELDEPYEATPLQLDGIMRSGVDDSYIGGFKLPIIAHVNRISGEIFPNAVVILEGVSNKVLTRTDYRGIIIDWIPFDEYNSAIFVSANNIVYTQLSKEEIELYVFNYIVTRASIANAPFRMVHSRLG